MKRFDFMTIRSDLSGRIFSTAALIAVFMLCAAQAWAATISVTTTDIAAISGDGKCSLLEAIQAANTDTAVDACPAGSGADVIELQPYTTYTQNVNTDQAGESAFWLTINSEITINAHGAKIVKIGSAPNGRFIVVNPDGNLILNDLTVSHKATWNVDNPNPSAAIYNDRGILTINKSTVKENNCNAILANGGKITVNKSTIDQNNGVGISNSSGIGINPLSVSPSNGAFISNSIISNNTGGGIRHSNFVKDIAYMEITDTIIKANGSLRNVNAGSDEETFGVKNNGSNTVILIRNSNISENIGGGIISNISSTSTIINSTISDNKSGAIGSSGNGIRHIGSNTTLINSTISGNLSTGSGGGILQFGGCLRVINSTITNNKAKVGGIYNIVDPPNGLKTGTVEVINSIIAGNSDLSTTTVHPDVSGPITGNHNNLIGNITGATGTIGTGSDIVNPNPLLDTLKSNGGFTQTHALLKDSPAIDNGDNAICAGADVGNIDQRGKTRPYGTTCDIGSYEYRPYNTDVILEAISNPSPVCPGDSFDVTFRISSSTPFIETSGYLYFDPKVLQVNSMSKKFTGIFPSTYDNAKGVITFGANGYSGFSNINPFFTVNFKVVGMNSGSTLLDFDDSKNKTYDINADVLSQTSEDVTIVVAYPTADKDADGVLNTVENNAPDGDGNGDGIFDSVQNNVTSLPSVVTNDYITLGVSPASCAVKNVISKTEKDAGSGTEDPDGVYPQGLLEFDIPCDTAAVKIFYHGQEVVYQENFDKEWADGITINVDGTALKIPLMYLTYHKYGPMPPDFVQSQGSWYTLPDVQFGKQMIGGKNILTASFTLKDGQLGDDTAKDGKIYDAGGLAVVFASLNVSKTGGGTVTSIPAGISCGTDCTENYVLNTQVTLTAAPADGYVFKGWGGDCSGAGVCQVTMDRAKSVSAEFATCDSVWLNNLINSFKSEPLTSPPRSIYQYDYNGKTVYYVPPICCDIASTLYDACGNVICHPDGDFIGEGDQECPDFIAFRMNEKLIFKDIIAGDIDNKGTVNLADAILALQVVAGLNPPDVNVGADLNGDKKIGLEEAVYILQKVAGLR